MSQISVHGTASATLQPELAVAKLTIEFAGGDHHTTIGWATDTYRAMMTSAEMLLKNGQATRVAAPSVRNWVAEETLRSDPGLGDRKVTQHRAGTTVDVWFTDLGVLGAWLGEVVKLTGVEVRGVAWDVTEATRELTMRSVRIDAARDAVQRAADYADALGLGDVRLLGIYEVRPDSKSPDAPPTASKRVTTHSEPSPDLRPSDVVLSAFVRAEFEAD